jgi:class 3 adenylate cyclase/tetratricopeptide (TPR) repeat protein
MVILYRVGRQADALEVYRDTRRLLIEELGIEPSPQLRDLEQSVLRQDPALVSPARIAPTLPVRKTVTVLFADLVDSTALTEQLDPEALRQLLDRTFTALRGALERHGGTVEKFIGDAVLAVFGVPAAHEDDALRAVRAALEMQNEVAGISDELERDRGLRLRLRIGVNTGQVFAGEANASGAFVTGAAVNAAKRLEEAAPPGEVLLGAATLRLARDAVEVEPVELLRLSEDSTVGTWRLLGIVVGAPAIARRLEASLVGRQEELAQLRSAFEQAREERRCKLLVLAGEPGIGKTRLARELVAAVRAEATVLTGACVSYGDGATWLPLAEMVHQLGDPAAVLAGEERGEIVAQRIEELIGLSEGAGSREEAFWSVRQLLEAVARKRPLVAVFEDVHWAEPTLLDLIENLGERSAGAPLLVLGLSRPELLEARPHLAERAITLGPLPEEETRALVDSLEPDLERDVRARVVELAEGNPLFVEQLVAYAEEEQDEAVQVLDAVPPSVEALLASRLDLLAPEERTVLQRAAVVGREFRRDALTDLFPPEASTSVETYLQTLAGKGLVQPSESDDRLRFHHVLVRDVAYAGMPKAERARLHERLADWLENSAGERIGEVEEIVAYHLEQAYHYRVRLNPADRNALDLASRAAELLESAARRAGAHEDMEAAAKLLHRATELLPRHDPTRVQRLLQLGETLRWVRSFGQAAAVLVEAVECARAVGDRGVEWSARLEQSLVRRFHTTDWMEQARSDAEDAIAECEQLGYDPGLVKAWRVLGAVEGNLLHIAAAEQAFERALVYARRSGNERAEREILGVLGELAIYGPTPVNDAIRIVEGHLRLARVKGYPHWEANCCECLAVARAMLGAVGEARALIAEARTVRAEFGLPDTGAAAASAAVEALAGSAAAAEREYRTAQRLYEETGSVGQASTMTLELALLLCLQGRDKEALELTDLVEEWTTSDELDIQVLWRRARAKALAGAGGDIDEAERLSREAVEFATATDDLNLHGDALIDLAELLSVSDHGGEAVAVIEEALRLYERKGNLVSSGRARALLDTLGATA